MSHVLNSHLLAAFGIAVLANLATPARAAEAMSAPNVVELFTSQGCSSCPPADRLAGDLAKRDDLIVLSLHVDYWDYLGWKDTFGQAAFTKRQRSYAATRGDGQVYTPQMVVNGLAHAVGSDVGNIESAIAATGATLAGKRVAVTLTPSAGGATVQIGDAPAGLGKAGVQIMLADFKSAADVAIRGGENGGKKVTYVHVVRELKSLGAWTGKAQTIALTKADLAKGGSDGCAVFLQAGEGGPILGGAQMGW